MSLRLEDLKIPGSLEFAIVLKNRYLSPDMEFFLQGTVRTEQGILRTEAASGKLTRADFATSHQQTEVLQNCIDSLYKELLTKETPLFLS